MDTQAQLDTLNTFLLGLPIEVVNKLAEKGMDVVLLTHGAGSTNGLVLREMGFVCEGVKRVLAGEDSAANLVSFIEKDSNIEEDNREKIPQIAYEIQTRIFDAVFPIFKEAGLPLREGRVPQPSSKEQVVRSRGETGGGAGETTGPGLLSPYAPVPSPIGPSSIRPVGPIRPVSPDSSFSKGGAAGGGFKIPRPADGTLPLGKGELKTSAPKAPLEEKNIRALTRIAAGTSYTEDALRVAFEDLPQGLRQAISSVDTANAIQEIAKQYLLHVDQMGALASETGLVLLGLTHPAAFIGNLAKRLRLPEERAKEIAREVSAKILVKVRDALRGLHEVKATSEYPNVPNQRMDTNKTVEPPKKLNVMPSLSDSEKLSAKSYQLKAGLQTPFSAGAKWNTGEVSSIKYQVSSGAPKLKSEENILARQAAEKEETLSREEVLRGIEHPTPAPLTTSYKLPTTPIGPTGWRPAAQESGKSQITNSKPTPSVVPAEAGNQSFLDSRFRGNDGMKQPLEKARPQSEGVPPPEKPAQEPQNFLDEKLAGPTGLPREEKDYTTDPYREPLQ